MCSEVLHSRPENIREFAAGENNILLFIHMQHAVNETIVGYSFSISLTSRLRSITVSVLDHKVAGSTPGVTEVNS